MQYNYMMMLQPNSCSIVEIWEYFIKPAQNCIILKSQKHKHVIPCSTVGFTKSHFHKKALIFFIISVLFAKSGGSERGFCCRGRCCCSASVSKWTPVQYLRSNPVLCVFPSPVFANSTQYTPQSPSGYTRAGPSNEQQMNLITSFPSHYFKAFNLMIPSVFVFI